MAEVALCSIFPPVKVGMTILTIASRIGEYRVDVAFLAGNAQVQAPQWITGFTVIEIRLSTNRFPGRGGMTFLTSNLHGAMWTLTRRRGCGFPRGGNTCGQLE